MFTLGMKCPDWECNSKKASVQFLCFLTLTKNVWAILGPGCHQRSHEERGRQEVRLRGCQAALDQRLGTPTAEDPSPQLGPEGQRKAGTDP